MIYSWIDDFSLCTTHSKRNIYVYGNLLLRHVQWNSEVLPQDCCGTKYKKAIKQNLYLQ